jgi:hypothetical protein
LGLGALESELSVTDKFLNGVDLLAVVVAFSELDLGSDEGEEGSEFIVGELNEEFF